MNELRRLVHVYQTGEATAAEVATLSERIRNSADDARTVAAWMLMTSDLAETMGAPLDAHSAPATPDLSAAKVRIAPSNRFRIASPLAIAAAILLTGAAFAIYLVAAPGSGVERERSAGAIATLIDTNTDLYVDDDIANPGSEYKPGRYMIRDGSADLQLTSGASVRMFGFTDLSMQTAMRSTLTRGSAVFNCPESAVGYTVRLPGGVKVVDLGTRFAIRVDDDQHAVVQVLEGKVRIDTPAGSHNLTAGVAHEIVDGVSTTMTDVSRLVIAPPAPPVDADAFASAIRELGPVAYWTGEAPVNGASLDAVSKRPAHVEGDVIIEDLTGNPHFELDGKSRLRLDVDDAINNIGNRLTVMAWVRLDTVEHQAILHNWSGAPGYTLEIHEGRPSFAFALADDGKSIATAKADAPIFPGRWTLLVGVYDGSTASLFVDGDRMAAMAVASPETSINRVDGAIAIGRRSDSNGGAVRGAIDDVAIFNTAITPEQIARLYHAARPIPASEATDR